MNSVILVGRLATYVDLKEVSGGSKVASFIIAVDRYDGEADFFRVKCWNSQAEAVGSHLDLGSRVAIQGTLRQDTYEYHGQERTTVSVIANRIELL